MHNNTASLSVEHITVMHDQTVAVWDVSLTTYPGSLYAIVGPNGAGKSTLLKAIVGLQPVVTGTSNFFGGAWSAYRHMVAYVPQRATIDWSFPVTVADVVMMGLYGQLGWFARPKKEHRDAVMAALDTVQMLDYAHRHIGALSGGQQQRVFLARALVADAQLLLLDEPFAGIDMSTESLLFDVFARMKQQGKTIVVVHHDLQTLDKHFDWVFLLNKKLIASGPTSSVLVPEYICSAYGDRAQISYIKPGVQL